jgi:hypothetical protein
LPSWKVRQVEPEGQAEKAQSWVQVPPVQLVLPLLELSGMHRLPLQPASRVQGEPKGWGVILRAVQAPVSLSQVSEDPQDQPRRQSGKHTLWSGASGEHT